MNRYVSLIPVGIALAAVSLAQPAQAQWVKGLAYYSNYNSQSAGNGTTVTNNPIGTIKINSVPGNTYNSYSTSGSYSGSVNDAYVWIGGNLTQSMIMQTVQSLEATGAGTGGGNSTADGQQAYGDFRNNPNGWDSKASPSFTYYFSPGVTPATQTQTVSLGGSTSAYYPNTAAVSAIVIFGDPVVTH